MKPLDFNYNSSNAFFKKLNKHVGYKTTKLKRESVNPIYEVIDNLSIINRLNLLNLNENLDSAEAFEEFVSGIYTNDKYNVLHQFIQNLSLDELNDIFENHRFNDRNSIKYKNAIYKNVVSDFLFSYYTSIEKVKQQFSFNSTRDLINNETKILKNHDFRLIAPLIIPHYEWIELVGFELKKADSIEEMSNLIISLNNSLDSLFSKLFSANVPYFPVEKSIFIFTSWFKNTNFLIYPLSASINFKKGFLKTLNPNRLQSIYNKSLNSKYDKIKKRKVLLEKELRKGKFQTTSVKYYPLILNGIVYLLKKQNPKIQIKNIDKAAKDIVHNLFHFKNNDFTEREIDPTIKMNNRILLEYLVFLSRDKNYIKCDLNKIPLIASKNINTKAKGFSYKNLYNLFNKIVNENELTFKGMTSVRALNNEMV